MARLCRGMPQIFKQLACSSPKVASPVRCVWGRPPSGLDDLYYSVRRIERDLEKTFDRMWPKNIVSRFAVPWMSESGVHEEVARNEDGSKKLLLSFDVRRFNAENIKVKAEGRRISVKAKQEETAADGGRWYREFEREYTLPEGLQLDAMKSLLTEDGLLTIEAPYLPTEEKGGPTEIPIEKK